MKTLEYAMAIGLVTLLFLTGALVAYRVGFEDGRAMVPPHYVPLSDLAKYTCFKGTLQ